MAVEGHYELLPAQGSPTKLGHSQQEFQWNEEPSVPSSPCSIDLKEFPFHDPAYIHQCEIDNVSHKPHHRTTASVSHSSICFVYIFIANSHPPGPSNARMATTVGFISC